MSTRSSIVLLHKDGNLQGIYCHNDGYLSHVGETLFDCYNTTKSIKQLLSFGDISELSSCIDACYFYGRDRGEKGVNSVFYKNIEDWFDKNNQDYNYLYAVHNKNWYLVEEDIDGKKAYNLEECISLGKENTKFVFLSDLIHDCQVKYNKKLLNKQIPKTEKIPKIKI